MDKRRMKVIVHFYFHYRFYFGFKFFSTGGESYEKMTLLYKMCVDLYQKNEYRFYSSYKIRVFEYKKTIWYFS